MDIVVTRHADQRIKERIPGMKSAEREERTAGVGAGIFEKRSVKKSPRTLNRPRRPGLGEKI